MAEEPAMDWVFMLLPNSYVEALIPSVMVFGSWGLWEVIIDRLSHEGRALMMGLISL